MSQHSLIQSPLSSSAPRALVASTLAVIASIVSGMTLRRCGMSISRSEPYLQVRTGVNTSALGQ